MTLIAPYLSFVLRKSDAAVTLIFFFEKKLFDAEINNDGTKFCSRLLPTG